MDYAAQYEKLISQSQRRPVKPPNINYEWHHIVPRCMGGSEDRENLVQLKLEEHLLAHLLLAKMYPDHALLVYAYGFMARKGSRLQGITKNKRYARASRAEKRRWASLRGNFMFRRSIMKPKRYGATDVARLKAMLTPGANLA